MSLNVLFKDELLVDEEILWVERANQHLLINSDTMGSLFIGMILLMMSTSVNFNFISLIQFLLALFFLVGYPYLLTKKREKLYYALTNYRVIFLFDSAHKKIESINIKILKKVEMKKESEGKGTIVFEEKVNSHGDFYNGDHGARQVVLPKLESIENIESVYMKILEVQGY